MKLLFDIYHVQIMDGDVIRRIRQHKDVHRPHPHRRQSRPRRTGRQAGDQLSADHGGLLDIGYKGYVGQEFIPTRDPLDGLQQAVPLCDV